MNPIIVHVGRGAPLRRSNVDTDQIVPAEYLKRVTRTGFADGCFAAWRREADFVLNQPQYAGASVLVAGPDFGTGSSREHAVWALQDFGFAVVLSSRFADIFRGNAGKAGLLAAEVPQPVVEQMWVSLERSPEDEVHVDLRDRTVSIPRQGITASFQIDDYTRWRLMEGLDDIALTLRHTDRIDRFEARRPPFTPTTLPRLAESDAPESLLPRGGIPKFH